MDSETKSAFGGVQLTLVGLFVAMSLDGLPAVFWLSVISVAVGTLVTLRTVW